MKALILFLVAFVDLGVVAIGFHWILSAERAMDQRRR
jgi:hypothetical protein